MKKNIRNIIDHYLLSLKYLMSSIDWKKNQLDEEKPRDIKKICFKIEKISINYDSFLYAFKMYFNEDQTQSHCYYVKEEQLQSWRFYLPSIQVDGIVLDTLKLEQNDLEMLLYFNDTVIYWRSAIHFKSVDYFTIDLSKVSTKFYYKYGVGHDSWDISIISQDEDWMNSVSTKIENL